MLVKTRQIPAPLSSGRGTWRPFRGRVRRRCICRRRGPGCRRRWCAGGTSRSTTLPAATFAPRPTSMLPRIFAPAPSSTPRRTFGWRSPRSLPVPPSVTSCRMRNVVFHDGRLADDDARAMIDDDARADAGGRVDVDAERLGDATLQVGGQAVSLAVPQPVGDAIGLQRVEAFVVEERLGVAAGGRVAGAGGEQVGADRAADRRVGDEGFVDQVAEAESRAPRASAVCWPGSRSGRLRAWHGGARPRAGS